MAKKILKTVGGAALGLFAGGPAGAVAGGVSGLLSKSGKKKAPQPAAAPATPQKGPIVTPLGGSSADPIRERLRRALQGRSGFAANAGSTILSNKLGG